MSEPDAPDSPVGGGGPARLGDREVLERIEAYCDLVPRSNAVPHDVGAFTLFVSRGGYDYYARPRLDLAREVTPADVAAVLERQDRLGVPRALEWVAEVTPSLEDAALARGLSVQRCPLLVLVGTPTAPAVDAQVRVVGPDDADLAGVQAAVAVGFAHPGTDAGSAGLTERDAVAAAEGTWRTAVSIRAGETVVVAALLGDRGPVGGGSHRPRGRTTEVTGVAVLPAYRRRGLAAALTAALALDALASGVTTVFCGAEDDAVARVYEGVGFRRVGTACLGRVGDVT